MQNRTTSSTLLKLFAGITLALFYEMWDVMTSNRRLHNNSLRQLEFAWLISGLLLLYKNSNCSVQIVTDEECQCPCHENKEVAPSPTNNSTLAPSTHEHSEHKTAAKNDDVTIKRIHVKPYHP